LRGVGRPETYDIPSTISLEYPLHVRCIGIARTTKYWKLINRSKQSAVNYSLRYFDGSPPQAVYHSTDKSFTAT